MREGLHPRIRTVCPPFGIFEILGRVCLGSGGPSSGSCQPAKGARQREGKRTRRKAGRRSEWFDPIPSLSRPIKGGFECSLTCSCPFPALLPSKDSWSPRFSPCRCWPSCWVSSSTIPDRGGRRARFHASTDCLGSPSRLVCWSRSQGGSGPGGRRLFRRCRCQVSDVHQLPHFACGRGVLIQSIRKGIP